MFHRVLLCYDGTREGRNALRQGADVVLCMRAEVYLLAISRNLVSTAIPEGVTPELCEQEDERADALLQEGIAWLRERGAVLHPIELQPDGIDTEVLARALSAGSIRPKLAHIIPNFQNPAGYTLSLAKRHALLALAARHGFLVFEDDPYVALRFSGESLPTMLSIDPERVVYASSFSKTVCPGIRVGYLVGPPDVIAAIARIATNTYISPNMVAQSIVYEFCASGAIERSIETVRTALAKRALTLAQALRRELPEAEFVQPEGGYFMWVTLPPGTDVARLFDAAAELGVAFVKGTDFLLDGGENTLRLAYSGVTPEQIEDGVARLAAAYRSL